MTASPIARLVVVIIGAVLLIIAAGAVYGDLTGRTLSSDTLLLGTTALGFIGGVLSKTYFEDKPTDTPQPVEIIGEPVEVTESVRPPERDI